MQIDFSGNIPQASINVSITFVWITIMLRPVELP